jgi:1-acyl-sn-glycerol-3-phosphate acyltransferase
MFYNFVYEAARRIVYLFVSIFYRVRLHGELPEDFGKCGYIIVSNHQNYFDPIIIAVLTVKKRVRFSFMAKTELFEKSPFFAAVIKFCGAFPVHRGTGDNEAVERAVSDIENGKVFVIFAEGHRSKTGEIAECKTGFARIAEKSGCKILPSCIVYGLGGDKKRIDFALGEPFRLEENHGREYKKQVAAELTERLRALQKSIYEEESLPPPGSSSTGGFPSGSSSSGNPPPGSPPPEDAQND